MILINPEWTILFKIWSRLILRILKVFLRQFFVNHPVYAITVIFICLLSDKASNAEFFQIFPCELNHTYSTFRLLSLKTKRTIAYSNPTASCLSPRLKSTGNNRGETEVFNAVRRGFPEVKLQIETAVWPRQNRGKWFHSFRRYCNLQSVEINTCNCIHLPPLWEWDWTIIQQKDCVPMYAALKWRLNNNYYNEKNNKKKN